MNSTTIKNIFKSIFVILGYYFYYYIFTFALIIILSAFKVDVEKFVENNYVLFMVLYDISLTLILFLIYRKDLIKEFHIFKKNWKDFILGNIKYWCIGIIIMSVSNTLINIITSNEMAQNEEVVRGMVNSYPIYGAFTVILIAPIVEEIVFRKTFKDIIKNKYVLMAVCGIAFGLIHVIGTYKEATDLLYIIPYGVFGSVFAYLYYKTKTVFTSMSIHLFHNALLLSITFIMSLF